MLNKKVVVVITVAIVILAATAVILTKNKQQPIVVDTVSNKVETPSTAALKPEIKPAPTVFYPIANYSARLTKRVYGQHFTTATPNDLVCGGHFTGYHNGDDLEATAAEINNEVPVFAVSDGTVRQFSHVNGYGGLLVIEHQLNNETVTVNYGHVDLTQPKVAVNDAVKAGQLVAYLGAQCSSETDGERQHLHLAIHRGGAIDVKGYVQTTAELKNWLNPKELLGSLQAAEPTL